MAKSIPVKKAILSAKEKKYPKVDKDLISMMDDNYPDEPKPTDHIALPNTPLRFYDEGNDIRPATRERNKGNSIEVNINLPNPEKKRKKSVASY